MQANWKMALKESISEVYSTMFFMVPEPAPELETELAGQPAGDWLEGLVELKAADQMVRVYVWSPPQLALELAANILSLERHEVSGEDSLDAYREMLNMVVGRLLTVVDAQSQWAMGLPVSRRAQEPTVGAMLAKAADPLFFESEGMPLLAGIGVQSNA